MVVIYSDDEWSVETYSDDHPELIKFIKRDGNEKMVLDRIALWDDQTYLWGPIMWRPLPPAVPNNILWRIERELRNRAS